MQRISTHGIQLDGAWDARGIRYVNLIPISKAPILSPSPAVQFAVLQHSARVQRPGIHLHHPKLHAPDRDAAGAVRRCQDVDGVAVTKLAFLVATPALDGAVV